MHLNLIHKCKEHK